MSGLLDALNCLLAEALAGTAGEGGAQGTAPQPARVRSVVLDDGGARIVIALQPPAGEGELVLRLRVEPARDEQQTLSLTVEQGPQHLAPALEPFRRVLERARLRLELDFAP